MGAKTALLAFTEGDLRPALRGAVRSDPAEVIDLVRELHPDYEVTPIGTGSLCDYSYPADDSSYATLLAGAELICDQRFVCDPPSQLPARLLQAGAGRRIIMHGMHSVSQWLCFAARPVVSMRACRPFQIAQPRPQPTFEARYRASQADGPGLAATGARTPASRTTVPRSRSTRGRVCGSFG